MASFDENGKYIKTNWKAGDKITATKLNKIEESIEAVNDNDISRHVEADARLDALEAKDVAHDKELTNVKNLIEDAKDAAELGDYEINSRMQFLEDELEEAVAEVNNVANTVDGKIAAADANMTAQVNTAKDEMTAQVNTAKDEMTAQVNQGKADMEAMVAEVEGELDGINSQLEHIEKQINITPDGFEGTDVEKMQKALDYAIENDIKVILLNRTYDLTSGTVYIKGNWSSVPIFKDGKLIKNDEGFMFDRIADNNYCNTPTFYNVYFEGNSSNPCYIINGDTLIRQGFESCHFQHIALVKTTGYIQSLRLNNSTMYFSPDVFISCAECYDVNITNNQFEESHNTLIKCYSNSTNSPACHALRITNNLIEGYSVSTPIIISSAHGLVIENNYFEGNKGDIEFVKSDGIKRVHASISNNSFFVAKGEWNIKSSNGIDSHHGLVIRDNISTIGKGDNLSFVNGISNNRITGTSLTGGGRLVPKDTEYYTDSVKYSIFDNNGYSAIRITPRSHPIAMGEQEIGIAYLIKFSGTFGSSRYYRSVFLGILLVGGNYDSTNAITIRELKLTPITSMLMQGNHGNIDLWDNSYVTVTYEATNSKKIETTRKSDIIITFNNIKYSEYSEAFVTNINGILTQGLWMEQQVQE